MGYSIKKGGGGMKSPLLFVVFFTLSEGGKKNPVFCPGGKKNIRWGKIVKINCPRGVKLVKKLSKGGKIDGKTV